MSDLTDLTLLNELKIWANSGPLFVYFCPFLIPISMIQIEKTKMVCLVFEPGPQNGRRRRNHGAMAAAKKNVTQAKLLEFSQFEEVVDFLSSLNHGNLKSQRSRGEIE